MIFDERDLEQTESKEELRKKHKVTKTQLTFSDIKSDTQPLNESGSPKRATKGKSKPKKADINPAGKDDISDLSPVFQSESENKEAEPEDQIESHLSMQSEDEVEIESVSEYESHFYKDEEGNYLKNLDQVIHDSMIPYSEYVIMDRALPRVEDGLKPVQRRILYAMYEQGFTPDKPYKKCANTVGYVLGKYHPHGDTSVYNAQVRLAQNFNMREILVDGHGNFGSIDGDSAAAMRYTESKLAPLAMELLCDIEKDTVRWTNNYDDTKEEPEMLPGRFPNLLVNGASGIAVGLATNIPTHNLSESIDAAIAVIDNEKISVGELMKYIKGPDFPTGGIILGGGELRQAYETGKGKILLRAKVHIEQEKNDRQNIVITEFPYQVNKANLLQKIVELKEKHKEILAPITDIRDESDRTGIRAVICLKKDANAEKILQFLYKYTELQTTFGINMVAIANGKPLLLGLKQILTYYVNYQREVVLKRTKYDLEAAIQKAHILEGLLIAIKNIDEVIKIIKKSEGTVEAKQKLKEKFKLSETQAQAILDMRLARLTNLETEKIETELSELENLIKNLTAIVNSKKLQMNTVKAEMLAIKKKYGNKRLTKIETDTDAFEIAEDVEVKPVKDIFIAYSSRNAVKKIPEKSFMISARSVSSTSTLNEVHSIILKTKTDRDLILFSNFGNCYKIAMEDILEARWKDRGSLLTDLIIGYSKDEKIVAIFDYKNSLPKYELLFVTSEGAVRKTNFAEFDIKKQTSVAFKLKEGEKLIAVEKYDKTKTLLFVSENGMTLNAVTDDIPVQSKTSHGVKGFSLSDGDTAIYARQVTEKSEVMIMTDRGYTKKIVVENIGVLARNRKGVKITTFADSGKKLLIARVVDSTFEIYALTQKDKILSIKSDNIALENRTTKGKPISKLNKGEQLKEALLYLWS